jgi:uncharacterized protein
VENLFFYPTLKWSLEYISHLKKIGKIPLNTFLTLNTNATLISSKVARLLKKHNVSASVSVDGPQEIHDSRRIDISGKGSFSRAIKGLKTLKRHGVNVGISCVAAMHNLNQLDKIAEYFFDEIGLDVIGFNILLEGGIPEHKFNLNEYSENLADKLVKCFQLARERGKQEERSFRLARSFAEGRIHYYDCSACGQQLVVDPRGRFGLCHAYVHNENSFFEANPSVNLFSHPLWKEWKQRSPLNMEQCQKCIALGICGGGCPYNAEVRKGSIWEVDESFCPFVRSLTTFLIKEVARAAISDYS